MIVTFDWRIDPGTMIGRHIIGAIELSSAMRSTSPRSSHLNFLFCGYFLHSRSASCSPGSGGALGSAGPPADVGGVAGGAVTGVGGGGVAPRVPVGGGTLRPCATATAGSKKTMKAIRIGRVKVVLIESQIGAFAARRAGRCARRS